MTRLISELLLEALEGTQLPDSCHDQLQVARRALRPSLTVLKEAA
jgi:hypothetical protein